MLKDLINLRPRKNELEAFLPNLQNHKMQFRGESFNSNLRLAFFDNPACIFNSINWQHILGKHSVRYFDFDGKHIGDEKSVHMFDHSLNQQDIAELMDKVLEQLLINGFDFNAWAGSGETEKVIIGQYTLHIGVKGVETGYQIGQFYPSQGSTVTKFKSNLLNFLKKLLNR
jgi:hypothetical protein